MKITGHQPNYLPYPGFFHKIIHSEAYILVDTTQFVKRGSFGWIHRNRIRTSSAEGWNWLTVPVMTKGKYFQSIKETRINNALPWARKHLHSLEWNYSKSPYFEKYRPYFEDVFARPWENLCELSEEFIRFILRELEIDVPIHKTSELGTESRATELIIDFCKKLGADAYVSGIHGRDYLETDLFEKNGVRLIIQEFAPVPYPQQFEPFIPNLSIIDMLLNIGPDETRKMLEAEPLEKTI